MAGFPVSTRYPAAIAGTALSNAAWFCLNPEDLLTVAPEKGSNLSRASKGSLGRIHFDAEQTVDLRFEFKGAVNPAGVAYPDPEAGLSANKKLFIAAFYRAPRDAFWCVPASITDLDGEVFTGPVQPLRPLFGEGLEDCGGTMSVKIPRGELTSSSS